MPFANHRQPVVVLILALTTALVACDAAQQSPTTGPTSTVAVETPQSTVTPAPTATATGSAPTATTTGTVSPTADGTPEDVASVQIGSITMFGAGAGWALGRPAQTFADQILITTDGGAQWQVVTPEEVGAISGEISPERSAAAHFVSARDAWVVFSRSQSAAPTSAPRVWLTEDGGQSWQASGALDLDELPFEYFAPSEVGSSDGQFGWLMAHLGAGMSHDYIAIFTTADGGQTWQRVADPRSAPAIQACNKSGLVFTAPQEGWLTGNCPGLMQPLFLYRTTDGGASWSQTELPAPGGLIRGAGSALGERCGIPQVTVSAGQTAALSLRCFDFEEETSQSWLYTTGNGGASWQAQPLPEPDGVFAILNDTQGWYLAADESEPDGNSRVYVTGDGGDSWTTLAQVEGQGQAQIHFTDALHGWIALGYPPQRTLLYSSDGGETWGELQPVVALP